jgi:hypothetical protein
LTTIAGRGVYVTRVPSIGRPVSGWSGSSGAWVVVGAAVVGAGVVGAAVVGATTVVVGAEGGSVVADTWAAPTDNAGALTRQNAAIRWRWRRVRFMYLQLFQQCDPLVERRMCVKQSMDRP